MHAALHDPQLERQARRRAGLKMGWLIHAGVYAAVNLMLAAIATLNDRGWALYPVLGWGLGLAIHGIVVFLVAGGRFYERLLHNERRQLLLEKDPW